MTRTRTKKQTADFNAQYRLALTEGRVVRYGRPSDANVVFREYKSVELAERAVLDADHPDVVIVVAEVAEVRS